MSGVRGLYKLLTPDKSIYIGVIVSLLTVFYVYSLDTNAQGEITDYTTWFGQDVVCDNQRGGGANICVGSYRRGVPFPSVEGSVVLATEGRVNHQVSPNILGIIGNSVVWIVFFGLFESGYRLFKQKS